MFEGLFFGIVFGVMIAGLTLGLHWMVGAYPFRAESQNINVDGIVASTIVSSDSIQDHMPVNKFMID